MLPPSPTIITHAEIRNLIGMPESIWIDYKRDLQRFNDAGITELLKDVSAFANTLGGCIVYGISEEDGRARTITGIPNAEIDATCLRIVNLIAANISPAIQNVEVFPISTDALTVLVIRIADSPSKPHRVTYNFRSRFHIRSGTGIREMTDGDLRLAFKKSSFLAREINDISINSNDLYTAGQAGLINKIINRCIFKGPGTFVIAGNVINGSEFSNCQAVILSAEAERVPIRSSGIMDCIVTNCYFSELILLLPAAVFERFILDIPAFAVHCPIISDGRR